MQTTWRRALAGLVGIGIVTTAAAPARASSSVESTLALVLGGIVITDIVFATYGIAVAGKGELPSPGWTIAETVFTVPQTVAANIFYGAIAGKDDDDAVRVLALIPTMGVSILSTHGIWGTASTTVRPGVLAGSSIAVGANIALSTGAIAAAGNGHLSGRAVGITTMLLTAPQVAAASVIAANSPSSDRAGWIALSAWSGTLFVHGLVSAIRGHGSNDPQPAIEPDSAPPPQPPSPPPPANAPPPFRPPPLVPNNRLPLMVPESLRVGPTIVTDGVATAMGIGVSGVLY